MKAELVQGQFSRLTARNTKADETKQEGLCRDSWNAAFPVCLATVP